MKTNNPSQWPKVNSQQSFKQYLQSKNYSSTTITTILKGIAHYQQWLEKENQEPEQASYTDLMTCIQTYQHKQVSQKSVQMYVWHIKLYYDYLQAQNKISQNPARTIKIRGVKKKKLYHILKPHQLHALYHQYKTQGLHEKRNKTVLGLMVYQGLKTTDLGKLQTNDVKLRAGQLEVPGSRTTNHRTLPLEPSQVMDMYDYILQVRPQIIQECKSETTQLFIGTSGSTNVGNMLSFIIRKLKKQHPQIQSPAQIRTSVITKWLKQYNLREVQYMTGHKYISSTEQYQINDLEGLQEEINQYHPLQ